MAKFCQNCGTPYEEGTMFCSGCGSNLGGKAAKKSAITLAGVQDLLAKKAKVLTVIILIVSLLVGVAAIFGQTKVFEKRINKDGDMTTYYEHEISTLYVREAQGEGASKLAQKYDARNVGVQVITIIYGVASLAIAALAAWSLLEDACGGCGKKQFKLMALVAAASVVVYIILFLILGRFTQDSYQYIVTVPVSAWLCLALYGGTAAACYLPAKKK